MFLMTNKLKLASLFVFAILVVFSMTRCAKNLSDSSNSKLSSGIDGGVSPNLLPGKCPYSCHDIRCKAYENGYCGPDTIALITNPNNPYDSVGKRHNAGVRAILPTYQSGTEPTMQNSWSYTISYFQNYGYSPTFMDVVEDSTQNRYDSTIYTMTVNSLATYLYNSGLISSKMEGYMTNLGNLCNALNSDSVSAANYQTFANNVISLETTIVNDASLDSTEKYSLLAGTSVARYSTNYWMNYADSVTGEKTPGGGSWFSWSTVGGGDVSGAVSGAVTGGAAAGFATGGAAILPGAGVGAITGAVGNSIYEAGMQLWHHWFGGKP
jgi:hypothetical protein